MEPREADSRGTDPPTEGGASGTGTPLPVLLLRMIAISAIALGTFELGTRLARKAASPPGKSASAWPEPGPRGAGPARLGGASVGVRRIRRPDPPRAALD
ncbi:MAG: hypothetical protein AAB215_01690, partial [Planctomycetota bacterium]